MQAVRTIAYCNGQSIIMQRHLARTATCSNQKKQSLAKMKADLNQANKNGDTPALKKAYEGHTWSLKLLAEMEADLNQPDKDSNTPTIMLALNGHVQSL